MSYRAMIQTSDGQAIVIHDKRELENLSVIEIWEFGHAKTPRENQIAAALTSIKTRLPAARIHRS